MSDRPAKPPKSGLPLKSAAFVARSFADAHKYFADKVPMTSAAFELLDHQSRAKAFRIAGVDTASVIMRIRGRIVAALRGEITLRQLQAEMQVLIGADKSAYWTNRLSIVYRTNMSNAWAVGRRRAIMSPLNGRFTLLMYASTRDDHVRPSHAALDGKVFARDDAFWDSYDPPWEWGCRCHTIPLQQTDLDRLDASVTTRAAVESGVRFEDESGNEQRLTPSPEFDFPRDQGDSINSALARMDPDLRAILDRKGI